MDMATREPDMGGYIWMGDMMMPNDPSEMMMDAQMDSSFFTEAHLEEMRNRPTSMEGYMMLQELDEGMYYEDSNSLTKLTPLVTQTQLQQLPSQNIRRIKPVKHPGLKLQTPIAYQKDTDPNVIPIQKDGMAICEKCGAMGVKHAFYTKERRFCSLKCARGSQYDNNENMNSNNKNASFDNNASIPSSMTSSNMPSMTSSNVHNMQGSLIQQDYSPATFAEESQPNEDYEIQEEDEMIGDDVNQIDDGESSYSSTQTTTQVYHIPPIPPLSPDDEPQFPPVSHFINNYDWSAHLTDPSFHAAPVYNFHHAPMSDCWENITVGMKVEVENTDCDNITEHFPHSFWVASVQKIAGYKALLRYEGFVENASKDFWVNLCSTSVHPVGWCATRGKPLIPPKTIENKYNDWKMFLVKRLTGARTLPSNFSNKVQESMKSRFRLDLNLECVDKKRITQVKVATIEKIVGKRLQVKYYDDDDSFWCNEDSPLIHPVGWARRVGHPIDAPAAYLDRCIKGIRDRDDATEDLFPLSISLNPMYNKTFSVGMKLESVDPLNLSDICVATVMQVLKDKYMMIKVNYYDEDSSGDWFCYHMSSPYIFAPGFCAANGISLTPPKGYDHSNFDWEQYCSDTNSIPAPPELFNQEIPDHCFTEGMRLESADLMNPQLICVGTICRIVGRLLRVHFDGWEDEFDQWIDCASCDIYPVGWSELVSHPLEPPKGTNKPGQPKVPFRGGRRRRKNRVQKKGTTGGVVGGPKSDTASNISTGSVVSGSPCSMDQNMANNFPSPSALGEVAPFRTNIWDDQSSFVENVATPPPPQVPCEKEIPCLNESNDRFKTDNKNVCPNDWTVNDVCEFLKKNDCSAYCDNFSKRDITGEKLLTLTKEQCFDLTGMKAGPSIKLLHLISLLNQMIQKPNRFKSKTLK